MNDETQVALLFSIDEVSNYNLKILAPQGVAIGSVSEDTTKFYSSTSNKVYENADEAARKNNKFGFYYVKTIGDLKKIYKTDNITDIVKSYLNDSYDKVYYYDNINSDDFKNYFLKNCSIDEFSKKFKMKFEYKTKNTLKEKEDIYGGFFGSIKNELETSLLFQDEAKKQVINTLYNNFLYNRDNSHIILSGPSGVGKTKFLKILDSSETYPSLYVNFAPDLCESPRDYFNRVLINYYYVQLNMNQTNAPGIIMIDNFDSIKHEYDLCEFAEELKHIITTNKKAVPYSSKSRTGVLLDTSKITFIICGKFSRARECQEVPISIFKSEKTDTSKIPVTIDRRDLFNNYGFSTKFLSLFNTAVHMKNLSFDEAKHIILNSPTSPLILYCQDLTDQGVEVNFSEETISKICNLSYSVDTNLKKMDGVVKSLFDNVVLNPNISKGSSITISIKDHQYKKGSKKQ